MRKAEAEAERSLSISFTHKNKNKGYAYMQIHENVIQKGKVELYFTTGTSNDNEEQPFEWLLYEYEV
jgi:hypothetical protein